MEGYFEDAASIDYSLTQKYPFYCFTNSSWQNIFPMEAHWHYYVEILYCTLGIGKVIINGYTYEFCQGDIIFTFPRDVHTINTISGRPFEYIVIKLDPEFLFDMPKDAFMFKHFRQLVAPVPADLQLIHNLEGFNHDCLRQIHDLFVNRPYMFEWQAKSLIFSFFFTFSHYLRQQGYSINGDTMSTEDFSSITPAFEYIHNNFTNPITAADTASHCHLSYSYFSRQFKKITGITFTQYLNFIRITEAEKLLLGRKDSVTDISYKVGFTDTSYFIKQFKAHKKMTPKKFLQLVREDF